MVKKTFKFLSGKGGLLIVEFFAGGDRTQDRKNFQLKNHRQDSREDQGDFRLEEFHLKNWQATFQLTNGWPLPGAIFDFYIPNPIAPKFVFRRRE